MFQRWHHYSLNLGDAACLQSRFALCMMALLLPALLMVSCQGQDTDSTKNTDENWAELFFEERLSSLSAESDSSCFYIGTEDGAFFTYNEDGIKKYNTPFDRIYCVKQDKNKQDFYWVGTRNMGLHYCKLVGDSLVKQQSYTIHVKDDRFSVYDICIDKDTLYLGTSHGLFAVSSQVPQSRGSSIILEERWHKDKADASPVVVGKLCQLDHEIFFTTSVGIYKYSRGKKEVVISVPDTVMLPSLSKYQDGKIRAIIEDKLYTIDSSGYESVPLAHRSIDFVSTPDYIYQVSKDSLFVTSNTNGIGKRALPSPARRECRNLIYDDVAHDQVLLVTSHHLLRIPHHYSLPTHENVRVGISASCIDNDKAYFLFANKVFQLNPGDAVANEKCSLNASHHPSRITVYGDKLYYVAEKKIYCKNMDNGDEQFWALTNEPTALGSHNGNVYIGVRDSLLLLQNGQLKRDPIKLMRRVKGSDKFEEAKYPFITAFCLKGDSLLIATLNDGVYIGQDDHFEEAFSGDSLRFIRDIAIQGNNTFILTHRGLWRHSSDPQATSPHQYIDSKGFNHLLVNDQRVTLIADFGLREFMIHGDTVDNKYHDYYQDWSFRPELSLRKDSVMIISRNNGVLWIDKPLDQSSEIHWLEFRPSWRPNDDLLLVLICAAIALALLLLVWWLMRRRHKMDMQANRELTDKLFELRNRLRRQVEKVRSYGLSSYETLKQQAFDVAESNDVNRIEGLSLTIKHLLDNVATVKSWQQTWETGAPGLYLPESLNNKRKDLVREININSRKNPTDCVERIDSFLDYIISDEAIGSIKRYLEEQVTAVKQTLESVPKVCEPQITGVLTAQQDAYQQLIKRLESSNTDSMSEDEIVDLLKEVKTLDERHKMTKGVVDLERALCSAQPKSLCKTVEERDNSLLALIEDFKSSNSSLRTDLKKSLADLAENVEDAIKAIYAPWIQGLEVDKELLELVKISSTSGRLYKSDGSLSVRGVMMALLISGVKLSTSETKILLDSITYERDGDYKKEKSEAKTHLEEVETQAQLQQYAEAHPSSIAQLFCNIISESAD